jgi:hypothetical protein
MVYGPEPPKLMAATHSGQWLRLGQAKWEGVELVCG